MSEKFGDKLKRLRLLRNLNQEELRACLKQAFPEARISQTAISAWEARSRQPNERVLMMLSGFFGVSETYWFLDDPLPGTDNRMNMALMRLQGLYREYRNDLPVDIREQLRDLIGKLHVTLLDGTDSEAT